MKRSEAYRMAKRRRKCGWLLASFFENAANAYLPFIDENWNKSGMLLCP